jgi:hypothetical protein
MHTKLHHRDPPTSPGRPERHPARETCSHQAMSISPRPATTPNARIPGRRHR